MPPTSNPLCTPELPTSSFIPTPLTKREVMALHLTAAYITSGNITYAVALGIKAADELLEKLKLNEKI
jgi:hypothetical protein